LPPRRPYFHGLVRPESFSARSSSLRDSPVFLSFLFSYLSSLLPSCWSPSLYFFEACSIRLSPLPISESSGPPPPRTSLPRHFFPPELLSLPINGAENILLFLGFPRSSCRCPFTFETSHVSNFRIQTFQRFPLL